MYSKTMARALKVKTKFTVLYVVNNTNSAKNEKKHFRETRKQILIKYVHSVYVLYVNMKYIQPAEVTLTVYLCPSLM